MPMSRARCEWFRSIDVRRWQREGLLTPPGKVFICEWTCDGESSGSISVFVRDGSITLGYRLGRDDHRSSSRCISVGRGLNSGGAGRGSSARAVIGEWLSSISVASVGLAGYVAAWPIVLSWS
jgi:hypothetical protein